MRFGLSASVVLFSVVVWAQGPGGVKSPRHEDLQFTAADMQAILQKAPLKDGKPADVSTRLITDTTGSASYIRVVEPDRPHTHGQWNEIYVVQSGSGTLETGGTMKGPFTSGAVHHMAIVDKSGKPIATADEQAAAKAGKPASAPTDTPPPPGEDAAGTSIEGGRSQQVKPGDVIVIPAGVPHTWTKVDEQVTYFAIKYPKPQ